MGLMFLIAGTAIFTQVDATTSYWLIGAALVLRGIGLGGSMMPAMAAAYATLKRNQVPRATPALNVLQRVGGSIGAALLIVILQNRIISSLGEGAQGGVSGGALSDAARDARGRAAGRGLRAHVLVRPRALGGGADPGRDPGGRSARRAGERPRCRPPRPRSAAGPEKRPPAIVAV